MRTITGWVSPRCGQDRRSEASHLGIAQRPASKVMPVKPALVLRPHVLILMLQPTCSATGYALPQRPSGTVCSDGANSCLLAVQPPALQQMIAAAIAAGATDAVTQGNAANAAAVINQTQASRILGRAPVRGSPATQTVQPAPTAAQPAPVLMPPLVAPSVATPVPVGPAAVPSLSDYPG